MNKKLSPCYGCDKHPQIENGQSGYRVICHTKDCDYLGMGTIPDQELEKAIQQWNDLQIELMKED